MRLRHFRQNKAGGITGQQIHISAGHIGQSVKSTHQLPQRTGSTGSPLLFSGITGQQGKCSGGHFAEAVLRVNFFNAWQCALNESFR
ncbi:hypothetical protein G184_gp12 [Erwinia phage ENT90]|uniref:Uncharacterized protein n=1 Tax=Erwinia phage ENT90 TaxID=947843 RepID=F1BUS1_9CAUD|nr:hypothetical protein G184_gp12 [Erwinia phage ENT90]ADX32456.1 hypothetical protein [Erwinia phage ENT90]